MEQLQQLITFVLPSGTLDWFDVTDSTLDIEQLHVTLTEKNIPPLPKELVNARIISKGFKNITVSDFPIRGRRVVLTFRRRYWKVEGHKELLKRDISLTAPGTTLATEFADFLKDKRGAERRFFDRYSKMEPS